MSLKGDQAILLDNQTAVSVCAYVKVNNQKLQKYIADFSDLNKKLAKMRDTDFNDQGQGTNIITMLENCNAALKKLGHNVEVMAKFTDDFSEKVYAVNKDASYNADAASTSSLATKASLK